MPKIFQAIKPIYDKKIQSLLLKEVIRDELITRMVDENNKKREEQVIARLSKFGYTFKNRFEFLIFLKSRCSIVNKTDSKLVRFCVDEKPIFEWWNTIDFEYSEGKAVVYFGRPPVAKE